MTKAALDVIAYVGSRTTRERKARGDGIGVWRIDGQTGHWRHLQTVTGLANPSYLAFDRTRRFLYCVHGDQGEASAFRLDPETGHATHLDTQDCGGRNPVHLTTDPTNQFLIVANYATGTMGALPRAPDGGLGPLAATLTFEGPIGPHRAHQSALHPHHCPYDPSGRWLIVPDKGGDVVRVVAFDPAGPIFREVAAARAGTRPGAGPRHVAFHPALPVAYVAHELDSTIGTYDFDRQTGTLTPRQILPTTPPHFTGENSTAAIRTASTGRHVYISNRGHDSIAIFAVDPATGDLIPGPHIATGGRQPRFFAFDPDGTTLYAANELSHTIVAFHVDQASGMLKPTGQTIETGSPTCIVFNPATGRPT